MSTRKKLFPSYIFSSFRTGIPLDWVLDTTRRVLSILFCVFRTPLQGNREFRRKKGDGVEEERKESKEVETSGDDQEEQVVLLLFVPSERRSEMATGRCRVRTLSSIVHFLLFFLLNFSSSFPRLPEDRIMLRQQNLNCTGLFRFTPESGQ